MVNITLLNGREKYLLGSILFGAATATCILLYIHDNRSLIYFGDAVSHIVRARQFIDSQQPGILNIGTVWLPLPHLLLLPFVAFDSLFYSGLAGAVIGIPFLVGTGLLLFSIIESLTNSRSIAFLFGLLFGLNPNVIYIALTPMNEMPLLFFVTLGGYAMLKWFHSGKERWIIVSTSAVLCATLCRYEAWLLAPFVSIIALHKGLGFWNSGNKTDSLKMVFIAGICWIGIVFWFGWNYIHYGDALKFARWTYSVGTSEVRSTLQNSPQDVFHILGEALLWIFGPMMVIAGVLMIFSIRGLSAHKEQIILLLFFSLPAVFNVTAILNGFVQIDEWWWNWRFVLSFGLFLSLASAFGLQELFQKVRSRIVRKIIVAFYFAMPVMQLLIPAVGVAVFNDAAKSFDERSQYSVALGEELQKRYDGGSIALLTGYGAGQRVMISSRLQLKTFNIKYFSADSLLALSDRYIVLGKERKPDSDEFSLYWRLNREILLRSYSIRSENKLFVVLERKSELFLPGME